MKRLLAILFLICAVPAFAQWVPDKEVNGTFDASSYDLGDKSFMGDYFATYFSCMYPQFTNHIYSWSRSGSGWNGDYESQEEKWCLPLWNSFAVPGYDWVLANDNESLVSNTTYSAWQLIHAGPPSFYNGTAQTNEGIATAGITNIPMGRIPHDGSDGDSGAIAGNLGSMQAAKDDGVPVIDLWHQLWNNGWSADVTGARILGFSAGSHPFAAGGLATAIELLLGLNVETNVGSVVFNWSAATAVTNRFVVSGLDQSGYQLTCTAHSDRMPMGWDALGLAGGTITNNAQPVFLAMPSLTNAFNWFVDLTNCPNGTYQFFIDGQLVDTQPVVALHVHFNLFTNMVAGNPFAEQRNAVLMRKRDQKGQDPVTLAEHSAGLNGVISGVGDTVNYKSHGGLFYDTDGERGSTYVSDMAPSVSDIRQYDQPIHDAAVQTNHTFTFALLVTSRLAPAHR